MLKKNNFFTIFSLYFLFSFNSTNGKATISKKQINEFSQTFFITLNLTKNDFILKESIDLSIDNKNIKITEWETSTQPTEKYFPSFKDTKKIFTKNLTIQVETSSRKPFLEIVDANIYLSYYQGSRKKTVQDVLPLNKKNKNLLKATISEQSDSTENIIKTIDNTKKEKAATTWSGKISNLVATTETLWLRIILVLLLGLLMSLTPCIYPMVPITLGILQSSSSKSILYNFLQALSYTTGIATTFAILGLIAAFTGQIFGNIMTNPFFIIMMSALLVYLAGSMFNFYNMYTPKFMSGGSSSNKNKQSLLSIFIFGIISGTVASPCLSPGLILLLSIVTAIGSKLLGFVLLFAFGFGLGIPLLIIGTFSSSLNALPRAGMWMIEVKKIFGFMLIGMALYFLNIILPLSIILFIATIFLLISSLFYFYSIKKNDSKGTKAIKNSIGIICAVLSIFIAVQTYKEIFYKQTIIEDSFWYKNPEIALAIAKKEQKKLFIDVGGEFCSICKAIDNTLLSDVKVKATLSKFINLKITSSSCKKDAFDNICSKYKIIGFPTFLLIDSQTGNLIARWGSELYDVSPKEFIDLLKKY